MATQIAIDVYELGMGNNPNGLKYTKPFVAANIVSYETTSIYNFKGTQVSHIRSKIVSNAAGVLKTDYVAQTVAQIKSLLDA